MFDRWSIPPKRTLIISYNYICIWSHSWWKYDWKNFILSRQEWNSSLIFTVHFTSFNKKIMDSFNPCGICPIPNLDCVHLKSSKSSAPIELKFWQNIQPCDGLLLYIFRVSNMSVTARKQFFTVSCLPAIVPSAGSNDKRSYMWNTWQETLHVPNYNVYLKNVHPFQIIIDSEWNNQHNLGTFVWFLRYWAVPSTKS